MIESSFFLIWDCIKQKRIFKAATQSLNQDFKEASLLKTIQSGCAERFGLEINGIIRSINEMGTLIDQLPYSQAEISAADPQVEHLYVCFPDHPPEQTLFDELCKEEAGPDLLRTGKSHQEG